MKIEPCVRCGRKLKTAENINESGDPGIVVYTNVQTRGFRPITRSSARRRQFCTPCATSVGFGPPPDGAFNFDVYEGLAEVVKKNPGVKDVAWEQKFEPPSQPRLMPGSKPDESMVPRPLGNPFRQVS